MTKRDYQAIARTHHVSPGLTDCGRLFVTIKVERRDGITRLSITGVEGPKRNGDARGSCGQCVDALDRLMTLDAGWSPEMVRRLKAEWERWHLNDMRAGCEHQRKAGWDTRPIDPSKPLDTYGKHFPGQQQASWNMLTWIRRNEHPEGLLCEPCDVCGYKFGSAWKAEEVPQDVLAFLGALPQNDGLPGCWR